MLAWAIIGLSVRAHGQTLAPKGLRGSNWSPGPGQSVASQQTSAARVEKSAIESVVDPVFKDLPDWAKRIEFDWDIGIGKADFSLLTVQPLYRSDDWVDTLFTQARIAWVENDVLTTNLGLGYRRRLAGDVVMLGGNVFFDSEWTNRHRRFGVGLEVRTTAIELNSNYYNAVTGKRKIFDTVFERPLDGFDVELGVQLPYLPWAHVFARRAHWDGIDSKNIHDTSVGVRMRLSSFLEIEAGYFDDNITDADVFVSIRLSLGGTRGTPATEEIVDSQPWRLTTMRDLNLDKVRRDNNIRVEITQPAAAGGVTVTISRGT